MRPPVPPEPSNELTQLQRLLSLCADLSKEVAKPDTEWASYFNRFGPSSSDLVVSKGKSYSS